MVKNPTAWATQDGNSILAATNAGVQRLQENNVVRVTESGVTRVLEDTVVTPKEPTVWADL